MKVSELKQKLEHANDNDSVMVAVKLPYATVGPIPTISVKYAFTGFDWEKGKFILTPEENLTPSDRNFETTMKEMQDKIGWLEYEKRGLKSEVRRLKKQLGIE